MKDLVIKDYERLREYLEDPINYDYYSAFLGGEVIDASVEKYQHPGGALIEGERGRWWIYVRVRGEGDNNIYDIALWKLRKLLPELQRKGIIETREHTIVLRRKILLEH